MLPLSLKHPFTLILILFLTSCNKTDETIEPITTDISISSSTNLITWVDEADLTLKLDNALSYSYGVANASATQKQRFINNDTSEVVASIAFKTEFQNLYTDTNPFNNSVTIDLEKDNTSPQGVELKADGPGNTYDLITSVLAPGNNPIEAPDCSHPEFGDHIDELFDNDLNTFVFRFFTHTTPDDDRCIVFDRQRNEIKSYSQSPDNLLGIENETVIYNWKFKLNAGFQASPNFTHLHQLKSVGGDFASMPMYTLTARKGNPNKLELRYAETDDSNTIAQTNLDVLIDTWLEVTETITYGTSGAYAIEIKKVSDDSVVLEYSNSSIVNWRPEATFVRPKWGIYRSLINAQDLRDEEVLFADFSITEID